MNFLYTLFSSEYLLANSSIVAALVAGIIAVTVALLTFIGVVMSNRSATKRAAADRDHSASQSAFEREAIQIRSEKDRAHASDEAHVERLTITRRQVYLQATEAWVKALHTFQSLAGKDLSTSSDQTYLTELATAFSQVALVAEQRTALIAAELQAEFNKAIASGMVTLLKQGGRQGELSVHDSNFEKSQNTIEALLAAMTEHNLRGAPDDGEFARLQLAFDSEQELATQYKDAAQKLRDELFQIANEFRMQQFDWAMSMSHRVIDFMSALRSELRIDTDTQAFHEQANRLNQEAKKSLEEFLNRAKSMTD